MDDHSTSLPEGVQHRIAWLAAPPHRGRAAGRHPRCARGHQPNPSPRGIREDGSLGRPQCGVAQPAPGPARHAGASPPHPRLGLVSALLEGHRPPSTKASPRHRAQGGRARRGPPPRAPRSLAPRRLVEPFDLVGELATQSSDLLGDVERLHALSLANQRATPVSVLSPQPGLGKPLSEPPVRRFGGGYPRPFLAVPTRELNRRRVDDAHLMERNTGFAQKWERGVSQFMARPAPFGELRACAHTAHSSSAPNVCRNDDAVGHGRRQHSRCPRGVGQDEISLAVPGGGDRRLWDRGGGCLLPVVSRRSESPAHMRLWGSRPGRLVSALDTIRDCAWLESLVDQLHRLPGAREPRGRIRPIRFSEGSPLRFRCSSAPSRA